jgi:hypothetical protein
VWLQNARGHHQDPYKFLTPILPGEPCSAKHTTDYEPGSSNFQNFSAVWRSMWVRNIHHSHKEIAGLSQVTWAAIHWPRANAFSTKKISIYIYIYIRTYMLVRARACVKYLCVRFTFVILLISTQNTSFQVSTALMLEFQSSGMVSWVAEVTASRRFGNQ